MADSDKVITITPNTSVATTHPEIKFVGKDNSPMYLRVLDDNSLSFEGTEGQVFSMSPTLSSGDIFSVNDISGVQSMAVNADGTITLNPTNSKKIIVTGGISTPAATSGGFGHIEFTANNNLYGTNRSATFSFRAPNSDSQPHMLVYNSNRAAIATGTTQSNASPTIWLLHDYYQPILDQTTNNSIAAEDFGLASASSMVSSAGTATNDPVILTLIDSGDTNSGDAIMAVGTGTSGGGVLNQISDGKLYFKIDDSGDSIFYKNVGIGTTSPGETLHVVGPDSGPIAKFERDGEESIFISGNNGWGNIYTSDAVLSFGTGGDSGASAQMALNGNVLTIGDGDTQSGTDGAKLHVHDVDGYALIQATGTGTGWINAGLLLTQRQASGTRGLGMFMHDEQNDTEWFAGRAYNQDSFIVAHDSSATSHDNDLADIAGSNGSPLFTIKDNGNVGIGDTNPTVASGIGLEITHATQANLRVTDSSASASTDFAQSENDTYIVNRKSAGDMKFRVNGSNEVLTIDGGDQAAKFPLGIESTSSTRGWNLWHSVMYAKLDYGTTAGTGAALQTLTHDDNEAGVANYSLEEDVTIRAVAFRTNGVVLSGTTSQQWRIFANGSSSVGTLTNISLDAGDFTRQNSENANATAHYYIVTGLNASYNKGDTLSIKRQTGGVDMGDVYAKIYYSIDC